MARGSKEEGLSTFTYEGVDKRGKKIAGEMSAKNLALAKTQLRKQGINVAKIQKKSFNIAAFLNRGSISPLDIAIFSRQLATMMKAGVPLVQSFEIVADGLSNPNMKKLVMELKTEVEAGSSLASAIKKHPQQFDELYCSLVDSGEQSGALETMLDRVAIYKEKNELLKQKIKKAFKYPVTVLVVAGIVTAILLLKVVPTFQEVFSSFGAKLPAFTQMVINLSNALQKSWWAILMGMVGTGVTIKYLFRTSQAFNDGFERGILKAPIFGDIIYKSIIARYCRTLSTTFAAGVPLIDALESTAGATNNVVYRTAVMKIREDISTGQQLQFAMRTSNVFPSMAIQMVAIGEETGALDYMLDKVATYYENEVDQAVDGLTSMMEPLIMAFLGIMVGGLVVAMYLPIFQMGSVMN